MKNLQSNLIEFFIARALPFGASGSVHGTNRAAMALKQLVHENVGTPCTHYFDVFTIIVPGSSSETADQMTGELLRELR